MLNIRVNRSASLQLETAAIFYSILPVRVQYAQAAGMAGAKRSIKQAVLPVGKAAKYLQYEIIPYGPTGMVLKITPYPKEYVRKDGGNIQIASAILLTGKKGGGFIVPKKGLVMKTRSASVNAGYKAFYQTVRKVAIQSKRKQIQEIARQVLLQELKISFAKQGFGIRGGAPTGARDVVR